MRFDDGRPERTIRLPDRDARPRMLYQRQLALANHLFVEHNQRKQFATVPHAEHQPPPALWGPSYARHLGAVYGCSEVSLYASLHLIPSIERTRQALEGADGEGIDLDDDEFYSVPERIGVFPCDAS